MAQYEGSYPGQGTGMRAAAERAVSPTAVGFTIFAAVMLITIGSFHFLEGLAAVLDDTFYVVRPNFAMKLDVTAWGWVHMIGGVLLGITGLGLMSGNIIARVVAVLVAVLSIVWNFYSVPYYPVWSILMISLGIGVIWALTAHGEDVTNAQTAERTQT